jgi:hypothetical protein
MRLPGSSLQHARLSWPPFAEVWAARHNLVRLGQLTIAPRRLLVGSTRWDWLQVAGAQLVLRYLMLVKLRGRDALLVWGPAEPLSAAAKAIRDHVTQAELAASQLIAAHDERAVFAHFLRTER